MGIAEATELSFEQRLEWHLSSNHYPPIHKVFVSIAIKAIDHALDEEWDEEIELPNGKKLQVSEIVDGLHLEPFIEVRAQEKEE